MSLISISEVLKSIYKNTGITKGGVPVFLLWAIYEKLTGLNFTLQISAPDLIYKDTEISDSHYPGLKDYIKVHLTRETHFGRNPNINESGYEN